MIQSIKKAVFRIYDILGWIRIRIRGSMPLTNGSGSGSGSGSCYFRHWLQDASKKLIFNTIFSAYFFLKVHLHHFSKIKGQKESQNSMMIEGSGSGAGSIPRTSGSGSGRPKNMWIRWIRIRIRIRNTARKYIFVQIFVRIVVPNLQGEPPNLKISQCPQ